jgi:excisionase family DNA binding protein
VAHSRVLSRTVTPDYISVAEAAVLLGVHRHTIYNAIRAKELPARRLGGRYLIPIAALRDLPTVEAA